MQPSTQAEAGPGAAGVGGGVDAPSTGATGTASSTKVHVNGGRFDFDDGGTYCGGWEDGKAHGHGVCTGPKGQGAYTGSWHYGFEVSGIYTWPSGSAFEGQWQNGKRHGLGVETRGRWLYRGEWTQGFKGRYGVRQSATSNAKYEGTWANGLQDGYGSETYADGGTYQGQWLRGMRHGYGVRASAPFGLASRYRPNKSLRASLTSLRSIEGNNGTLPVGADAAVERDRRVDNSRGGFVLKARSDEPPARRRSLIEKSSGIKKTIMSGLKIRKQRSTGDLEKRHTSGGSIRSTGSSASWVSTESSHSGVTAGSLHTDSNASFVVEDEHLDASVTETYMGEWKNDKRTGFGISERSDGLRYEGEWFANKKYGYGVTTLRDGAKEEGKYKNNVLITSHKKRHLFLIRSAKFRERIDSAVNAAQRASKIALQKADIAISRMSTARGKAVQADSVAEVAREDYTIAIATAQQFAPDFVSPGLEKTKLRYPDNYIKPILQTDKSIDKTTVPSGMDQSNQKPSVSISPPQQIRATPPPSSFNAKIPPSQQYPQSNFQPQDSMSYQSKSLPSNQYQQQQTSQQHQQPTQQQQQLAQQQTIQQLQGNLNQYQQKQPTNQPYGQQYQQQSQQSQNSNAYSQRSMNNQYPASQPSNQQYQSTLGPQNQYSSSQPPNQSQQSSNQYQQPSNQYQQQSNQYQQPSNQYQQPSNQYQQPPNQYQQQQYQQQPLSYQNQQSNSVPQGYGNGQSYSGYSQDNRAPQRVTSLPTSPYESDKQFVPNQISAEENLGLHQRRASIRRNSKLLSGEHPGHLFQQIQNDRYDQYKRPPSRDSSVDRYTRAASRLSGSRQPSVDKQKSFESTTEAREVRGNSMMRSTTPVTGNGSVMGAGAETAFNSSSNKSKPPFEDIIVRKRSLGQDIVPSPMGQPKRTESLYTNPLIRKEAAKPAAIPTTSNLQRKKSLPDFQGLPQSTRPIPREEASILSSARREEIRRQHEESERLRANPLLYLVSPHVRDWFSRQQLLIIVLFVNISLAIIFIKLLT